MINGFGSVGGVCVYICVHAHAHMGAHIILV